MHARAAALLVALLIAAPTVCATSVTISAEHVEALGQSWRKAVLHCELIATRETRIGCERGTLDLGEAVPLRASYDTVSGAVEAELLPAAGERWQLAVAPDGGGWTGRVRVEEGRLVRLAPFLPHGVPRLTAGRLSGTADVTLPTQGGFATFGELVLSGVGFSDATGEQAAAKVAAAVKLAAEERDGVVRYRAKVDWSEGEVYWQPLYLKAGHALTAEGTLDARRIVVDAGHLRSAGVGEVAFSASWDRESGMLVTSAGGGAALDIRGAYEALAQPLLAGTAAGDMSAAGTADLGWRFAGGVLQAFYVNLHGASFADRNRRFEVADLDAAIPWDRTAATHARVALGRAELLRLPIGRVEVPIELEGFRARVAKAEVPLLDGSLRMNDFVAWREDGGWRWAFAGGITPISVEALTRTLGVHVMLGKLSAVVPKVRYESSRVAVEGALLFQVFDGTVVVDRLSLVDPLGRAPRLYADLAMRNLDLDLVTRTFAFGSLTGRIDATVSGLELADWQPVAFDAWVGSSPGSYPQRISQRAVENIAALGGGSAAAAMQRTALRFFDEFGYRRIGWRCRLANGVCEMSGIAPKDGGYVIVEGGGVPAISVMGYNRAVDWQELITRLARVTREDSAPLIE